jgi:hypothetical protein
MTSKGREPPLALWRRVIARWSPDRQFDWAERAAILEYDASDVYPMRDAAERAAFEMMQGKP